MFEVMGKYASAKIFTDNAEQEAVSQVINLCNQDFAQGAKIRIMPDVHAGAGCVIGFTASLGQKVIPNLVGVDIGCGMYTVKLDAKYINPAIVDAIIHQHVPSGKEVHASLVSNAYQLPFDLTNLYCYDELKDKGRLLRSIGTLGGGNHFIELNQDKAGYIYLVIHSGSRNLGKQVAEIYQNLAIRHLSFQDTKNLRKETMIKSFKELGLAHLIQKGLKDLDEEFSKIQPTYPRDLCFLEGEDRDHYLHDMKLCQTFAELNRQEMANIIFGHYFGGDSYPIAMQFTTVHNYINFRDNIIRKGAVSAREGETLLIPINMRDGSLLCVGKGNADWNYSAPHGAGRLMSRSKAKEVLSLEDYKQSTSNIYTTSVGLTTLDEAPDAYKPIEEILENIQDTVEVIDIIKPIYNFKAGE